MDRVVDHTPARSPQFSLGISFLHPSFLCVWGGGVFVVCSASASSDDAPAVMTSASWVSL